jgi:aspartyl-tRNA(Asn)/glutamyl-tRNA(Gln) amidotransferase subunit C
MDRAQIRHVAELAELSLTDEEEEKMAQEIGRIVDYVTELGAIDTADVPPTAHLSGMGSTVFRPDEPAPSLSHDEALEQAPQTEHGGFAVPTFVES